MSSNFRGFKHPEKKGLTYDKNAGRSKKGQIKSLRASYGSLRREYDAKCKDLEAVKRRVVALEKMRDTVRLNDGGRTLNDIMDDMDKLPKTEDIIDDAPCLVCGAPFWIERSPNK